MNTPGASPAEVGRQLATRRESLDLTQEDLAQRIGIVARTVSGIERGVSTISRGKRPAWEAALGLRSGTISRAYRDGTTIEAESPDADSTLETLRELNERLKEDPDLARAMAELIRIAARGQQPDEDPPQRDEQAEGA